MPQVLRTYFDKNNTIIRNTTLNTGRNPVTELFYGGDQIQRWSRFLFRFDVDRLRNLHNEGVYPDLSKLNHTLNIVNTASFDESLLNGDRPGSKVRTSSFDLILFRINEHWDEGVGYDFTHHTPLHGDMSISNDPSNWLYARTNVSWPNGPGIYSGAPSPSIIVNSQHFDKGNESIEMDITNEVNGLITGNTNYGYGLAFTRNIETLTTNNFQYVGFFTRHTQTAYEPFVESTYNEVIQDDRYDFFLDKPNKLYLYSNLNGNPTNLDHKPSVDVYDDEGNLFSSYTQSAVTHVTKGVYSIDITVPSTSAYTDCFLFTDKWKNIQINGINRPNVEMDIPLKSGDEYFNIGPNDELPTDYSFSISGIKTDEQIIRGDVRKVFVHANIPYTVNQKEILDGLQYRLYVKEGRNEFTVIDYQDVERANNYNFFWIDTESLIPNTYYIEIKAVLNQEVKTMKDFMNFDIVGKTEDRESQ